MPHDTDQDLGTAPPRNGLAAAWRDLGEVFAISFPIIVAMASHNLMTLVDTWMLARYGANELASVGAAGAVTFVVLAFIFGLGGCTSTFVSQSVGRGQHADCARYTWQGLYFGVAAQAVVLPCVLGAPAVFAAFGHDADVQELEVLYFRIRMLHVLGTASYAALSSFFQGIGRPAIPMYAALIANLFNVVLDWVLIFGIGPFPEMGIAGAAAATTLASYFQVLLLLGAFLWKPLHERFNTRHTWRFDWGRFKRLMNIGAPAGASFSLHVASWAIFTNVLIGRLGRDILAANNVTHSILGLSFMPAIGLNKGITVLVGQYIGKRDIPAAKRRAYVGIGLAMAYMCLCGLLFVLFRRPIVRFFRSDPDIVEAGSYMLILAAIFQAFDALGIMSHGALRGAGDTKIPAIIDIAAGWLLLIPLGYFLTFVLKLDYIGAWGAAAVQIAIVGFVFFWRFDSEAWRKIDIFAGLKPAAEAPMALPDPDDHPTVH